jgi:hypothetical protein
VQDQQAKRSKLRSLPVEKIFGLSTALAKELPDIADRATLSKRVSGYLRSFRRGKLRLPRHFPSKVLELCNMSKTQIAQCVFWVKPNTSINHQVSPSVVDWSRRVIPGGIWNRRSSQDFHTANRARTNRLSKRDWPRISGNPWPSTPSVSELLEMSRRGILYRGLESNPAQAVENCLTRGLISNNIRVAAKVVLRQIVGVRSSVKVQESFLPYFRYRDGFLILTVRHKLPSGLVRFLLGQWIKSPTSLWLVENCRFKYYLKKHSADEFRIGDPKPISRGYSESDVASHVTSSEVGSLPSAPSIASMGEIEAEFGEEFAELFARLPDR